MNRQNKQLDPETEQKLKESAEKWAKLIDNARYLGVEHIHKEKEYGIKWRTVFKVELQKIYK